MDMFVVFFFFVFKGGDCVEVFNTEGIPLNYIVHHPTREAIVVMMESLTIGYFSIDTKGGLTEISKVKLSGKNTGSSTFNQDLVWAGTNCLAILTGKNHTLKSAMKKIINIFPTSNIKLVQFFYVFQTSRKRRILNEK